MDALTLIRRSPTEPTAPCVAPPSRPGCDEPTRPDCYTARVAAAERASRARVRRILAARLPAAVRSLAGARALYRATEGQGGTAERLDRAEAAYWQIAS